MIVISACQQQNNCIQLHNWRRKLNSSGTCCISGHQDTMSHTVDISLSCPVQYAVGCREIELSQTAIDIFCPSAAQTKHFAHNSACSPLQDPVAQSISTWRHAKHSCMSDCKHLGINTLLVKYQVPYVFHTVIDSVYASEGMAAVAED